MNTTKIQNFTVDYENSEEFHIIKREIFNGNIYYTELDSETPNIIDTGAHIGLATLFFKSVFPNSEITCFEPNPETFAILEKNVFQNNLQNVKLYNTALSDNQGFSEFHIDITSNNWNSTASFHKGSWTGKEETKSIKVPTVKLSEYIEKPVDILKMDIEGAEMRVLQELSNKLDLVKNIFLEYHPINQSSFAKIRQLLIKHNFRLLYFKEGELIPENKIRLFEKDLLLIEAKKGK